MNVNRFDSILAPTKNHIIYCIINQTDYYIESWNKEISKNLIDWSISNITQQGYIVLESIDEDSILKEAVNLNAKFAVVFTTGTDFINGNDFFDVVENFCTSEDFFLAGHILDRNNAYYELHHQCYIINLDLYKKLKLPKIGQIEHYSYYKEISPIRSEETIHDDYTPLWIKKGTELKDYTHKRHGWNIISIGLQNDYKLIVFDELLRKNKLHYYPDHSVPFMESINFAYNRHTFCSSLAIYPFNSEDNIFEKFNGTIKQLIVPASGLNWVLLLNNYGFDKNTVIKFYDYSLPTLELMKEIINWDGKDYPSFIRSFIDKKFKFLSTDIPYVGPQDLDSSWKEFQKSTDWEVVWNNIKSQVRFEFHYINLLDSSKDLDWIDNVDNTFINVSNIFNYIGTAAIYSVKSRVYSENKFLERLKEKVPNCFVTIPVRAADGFYNHLTRYDYVYNIRSTDIKDLNRPSWHQNLDW
jgi:hypothetical protein